MGMLRRPRSSRLQIIGALAVLALVIVGFAWVSVQSFHFIHGSLGRLGNSHLKPVQIAGAQQTVFRWKTQACEAGDIPDVAARAFRDATGRVHLLATGYVSRAMVGPDLNRVRQDCRVVMRSQGSGGPKQYADQEWIAAPYTLDGRTVYALVHDEYHGWQHSSGNCIVAFPACWYNAVTLARSDDGGQTFHHAFPPPRNLVAAVPYPYVPNVRPYGVFNPSNIVKKDGYYYSLVVTQPYRAQKGGTCVIRTRNLRDPGSWRAWDGDRYDVTFANPYQVRNASNGQHFCEPVSPDQIGPMSDSLTYNTYFGKYLLMGSATAYDSSKRRVVAGFYYSLSDDLVNWSQRKLVYEAELPWTYRCGDPDPVLYPSVLDPASKSPNFETSGRRPYLYFTRFHYSACRSNFNRDLVRVPISFSK